MDISVEDAASSGRDAVIWEFFIPKRAEYLSELYGFLRDALHLEPRVEPAQGAPPLRLDGYSVYEVDGAYRGAESIVEERVLVVRLILPPNKTPTRLRALGQRLLEITGFREEEVWIVRYSGARVHSFRAPTPEVS